MFATIIQIKEIWFQVVSKPAFFFGLRPKKTQGEKTQEIQKLKEKNSNSSLKINFSAKSDKNVNKLTWNWQNSNSSPKFTIEIKDFP